MKNLLSVIAIISILSSCSDKSTTPTPTPTGSTSGALVGVWNFAGLSQKNGSVTWDGVEVSSYTSQSSKETGTLELKADGTSKSIIGYTFTTKLVTGDQTAVIPPTTTEGTYTYDATAKTITTTTAGQTSVARVIELTATSMIIEQDVATEQTASGILVRSSNTTTMSYTR